MIPDSNYGMSFSNLSIVILIFIVSISVIVSGSEVNLDSLVINEDTVLQPGTYYITNGIMINSSDITLDCNGATLVGGNSDCDAVSPSAIYISGESNIIIKDCSIKNYLMAIYIEDSSDTGLPKSENIYFQSNIIEDVCVSLSSKCDSGCNNININDNLIKSPKNRHFSGTLINSIISNNVIESKGWFCSIFDSFDYLNSHNNILRTVSPAQNIPNILTLSDEFLESCFEVNTFSLTCPDVNGPGGCNLISGWEGYGTIDFELGEEASCGDGIVNGNETCSSCEADVGACPENSSEEVEENSSLILLNETENNETEIESSSLILLNETENNETEIESDGNESDFGITGSVILIVDENKNILIPIIIIIILWIIIYRFWRNSLRLRYRPLKNRTRKKIKGKKKK